MALDDDQQRYQSITWMERHALLEEIYNQLAQFPIPLPIELGDLPDNVLLSSGLGSNDPAPLLPRFTGLNPGKWISYAERYFSYYAIYDADRFPYVSDCFFGEAADWFSDFQSTEWSEFLASLVYRFGYSQHNQIAYALQSTNTEYALKVFDEMSDNIENAMVKEILKTIDDEILDVHTESTVDVNESLGVPIDPMDIFNYIFVHETVAHSIIILWAYDLKEHDMVAIKDYVVDFIHTKNFNAQHLKFKATHQLFYSNWQALELAFQNNGNSHMIEHETLTGGVHLWHKWKTKFWKSRSSAQSVLTNNYVHNIDTTNFESLSGGWVAWSVMTSVPNHTSSCHKAIYVFSELQKAYMESNAVSLVGIFSLWVEHEDLVIDTRVRVHICPMTKPHPHTRGSQPVLLFFYESYVAIETLLENFEGMSRQNVLTWTVFPPSLHSVVLKLGLAFKLLVPFLVVPFYAKFGCIIAHNNVSLPHSIHITPDGKQQLDHYMSQAWYLQAINFTVKVAQWSIQINFVLAYTDMAWFAAVQKMFALTSSSIIANVKVVIGVAVSTLAHVGTLYKLTYVILSLMTHGFCVHTILSTLNFSWLHWPQASPPLCEKQVAYISCLDSFNGAQLPCVFVGCLDPFNGAQLPRVFVGDKGNLNLLVTDGVNAKANLNMALTICLSDEKLFNIMFALAEVFEADASFMDPEITSFDAFYGHTPLEVPFHIHADLANLEAQLLEGATTLYPNRMSAMKVANWHNRITFFFTILHLEDKVNLKGGSNVVNPRALSHGPNKTAQSNGSTRCMELGDRIYKQD